MSDKMLESRSAASRRQRRRYFAGIAIVIGLSAGFFIVEVTLRVLGFDYRSPYDFDPHCGVRLRPGFRYLHSTEGRSLIQINSVGCRDVEHEIAKPDGIIRIAVLGDSFAESLQVDLKQTFWSVMEARLNECAHINGRRIEVLNFGVSGYGTTQELQTLRHYVWRYQPDVILLAFLPGNDVRNNCRELESIKGRPFYRRVNGRYELDLSFNEDDGRPSFRESRWLQFKHRLATTLYTVALWQRWKQAPSSSFSKASDPMSEEGVDAQVFIPPENETWKGAWDVTGMMLGLMRKEAESHNARLVVVSLNNAQQVRFDSKPVTDPPPDVDTLGQALSQERLDYPDERLASFAKEHQFPLILLTPPMRKLAHRNRTYFHGFENTRLGTGHWNVLGHKTAGDLIAREFCDHPEWLQPRAKD